MQGGRASRIALTIIDPAYSHIRNDRLSPFRGPAILVGILALYAVLGLLVSPLQRILFSANRPIDFGLAFVTGLLTGTHCIGMCGGFVLTCGAGESWPKTWTDSVGVRYAIGKTTSYSALGALCGALGESIAITPVQRGAVAASCGLFLLVSALCSLHWAGRFQRYLKRAAQAKLGPLAIGFLNGGMIGCGPLLSLYLVAAATYSPLRGAVLLFAFGTGTLPALLGFRAISNWIGGRFRQAASTASRFVILFFGLSLLNSGLALAGTGIDVQSLSLKAEHLFEASPPLPVSTGSVQVIRMRVTPSAWIPNSFVLRDHVSVRWIIDASDMSICTHQIEVPALELSIKLHPGINTVEFTPCQSGNISWSCWMGMVPGMFMVKDGAKVAHPY